MDRKINPSHPIDRQLFPIAAIGASAGGFEAFREIFSLLPVDTGIGIVIIQHLDRVHPSLLAQSLRSCTAMPVHEIKNDMPVEPNQVYVIPAGKTLTIEGGRLKTTSRASSEHGTHLPIDVFFKSIAADRGRQVIGVVLSGNASDGTSGLEAIKAEGGVTLVQDPASAKYPGMPTSAISAGVADFTLTIPALVDELVRLGKHPHLRRKTLSQRRGHVMSDTMHAVFEILQKRFGVNFSHYKQATLRRRISRRLALHKAANLRDYLDLLRVDENEVCVLFNDLLINVTAFFRDAVVFQTLSDSILPGIIAGKSQADSLRIWTAGCASGQEAYSLAIACLEILDQQKLVSSLQIFASDISERMIETARHGFYPENLLTNVSPQRLKQFFEKTDGGYRVTKKVRESIVFVRHDLTCDPPFAKLDLICCRNVLIYFDHALQKKLIAQFHYCLNSSGTLLLGRTESVSSYGLLFTTIDKTSRFFARAPGRTPILPNTPADKFSARLQTPKASLATVKSPMPVSDFSRQLDQAILTKYAPPGVVINDRFEILQYRGQTGPFIEHPPGEPQTHILKLVKRGLFNDLNIAIRLAKSEAREVKRVGVVFSANAESASQKDFCDITVVPLGNAKNAGLFAVLFELREPPPASTRSKKHLTKAQKRLEANRSAKYAAELRATKDYLTSLNQQNLSTNEELTSANEELATGNEEMQSLNEELETAKEELQSTNEELTTVNEELQNRNVEISRINDDLVNILTSVDIPILILDRKKNIRRFTPKAQAILNLLPADIGRPFENIRTNLSIEGLQEKIADVLATLKMTESEVQDKSGFWHRIQIRPYRANDGKTDGVVLSLIDVDALRRAVIDAEGVGAYAKSVVEALQTPLLVLDEKINVLSANQAFYQLFEVTAPETERKSLYEIGLGQWNIPALKMSLGEMLAEKSTFQNVEVERVFPKLGERIMSLSARSIATPKTAPMILLAVEDISDRKTLEQQKVQKLRTAEIDKIRAENENRTKDLFLATLSHELRTPLTSLLLEADLVQRLVPNDAAVIRSTKAIQRATQMQAQLIDDLLDVSRIANGKLKMDMRLSNFASLVRLAIQTISGSAQAKSITIEIEIDDTLPGVYGDSMRLQQVVWNLLSNAIKFSKANSTIAVILSGVDNHAQLQVIDHGIGIDPKFLDHVFERFAQAESAITRTYGGLGLGLSIVKHVIETHGGHVSAKSDGPGTGTTLTVEIPFAQSSELLIDGTVESNSEKKRSKPASWKTLSGARILVVEDDSATREALSALLTQAGSVIQLATSASEALTHVHQFRPDAIVCDIGLPDEDGYSLMKKIRMLKGPEGSTVPALALTAHATNDDRDLSISAGFQSHLAKPVDFGLLKSTLLVVLSSSVLI